jgi:hypothetical protein
MILTSNQKSDISYTRVTNPIPKHPFVKWARGALFVQIALLTIPLTGVTFADGGGARMGCIIALLMQVALCIITAMPYLWIKRNLIAERKEERFIDSVAEFLISKAYYRLLFLGTGVATLTINMLIVGAGISWFISIVMPFALFAGGWCLEKRFSDLGSQLSNDYSHLIPDSARVEMDK